MKIKTPDEAYIAKAKKLTEAQSERLLSRMGGKLRRRQDKDKVSNLEALAIQLEIEDEQLKEWRERMEAIKKDGKA
jgi:N-acyl-L-homoserine lactone synthetase